MNGVSGGKTLLTCSTSGESRSLSSLLSSQISGATSRQQHPTLRGMDLLQQPGTFCNTWGIASGGLQSVNDGYQFCQQQQGGTGVTQVGAVPSADRIPVAKEIPGGEPVFQSFQARINGYEAGLRMKGCLASVGALTLSNGDVSPDDSNFLVPVSYTHLTLPTIPLV